jgi:putative tryptophan/tyrosine transport system substrate-binding protein
VRRRKFITLLGGAAAAWPLAARAQQASTVPKVGFVFPGPEAYAQTRAALVFDGLRSQGFHDPNQVALLVRATGGDPARLAPLLADLISSKVDILLPMAGTALAVHSAAPGILIVASASISRKSSIA